MTNTTRPRKRASGYLEPVGYAETVEDAGSFLHFGPELGNHGEHCCWGFGYLDPVSLEPVELAHCFGVAHSKGPLPALAEVSGEEAEEEDQGCRDPFASALAARDEQHGPPWFIRPPHNPIAVSTQPQQDFIDWFEPIHTITGRDKRCRWQIGATDGDEAR